MSAGSKKEEIIESSIEIFVEEGFDRPTMDSIASRAQVSKRTLYKHFSSKRALLDAIFESLIIRSFNSIDINYNPELCIETQLEDLIQQKLKLMLCGNGVKLAKIIISEHLKDKGLIKDRIEDILKTESASLAWIKSAQEEGKLRKDKTPIEALKVLNEIIHGVAFFPVLLEKKSSVSTEDIQNMIKMFLAVEKG